MKGFLIIIVYFLAASCAPARIIGIEQPEPWLTSAVEGAISFWGRSPREVAFELAQDLADSNVRVRASDDLPEGSAAVYNMGAISIRPRVAEWATLDRICIVAHEMGHHLGMDHRPEIPSLMNPSTSMFTDDCSWSEFDQKEFCQTNDCED